MSDKTLENYIKAFEEVKKTLDHNPSDKKALQQLHDIYTKFLKILTKSNVNITPRGDFFEEMQNYTIEITVKNGTAAEIATEFSEYHQQYKKALKHQNANAYIIDGEDDNTVRKTTAHEEAKRIFHEKKSNSIAKMQKHPAIEYRVASSFFCMLLDHDSEAIYDFAKPNSGKKIYSGVPVIEILPNRWQAKLESLPGFFYDSERTPLVVQGYRHVAHQVKIAKNSAISVMHLKGPSASMRAYHYANFLPQALVVAGQISLWTGEAVTHQHQLLDQILNQYQAGTNNLVAYSLYQTARDMNDGVKDNLVPTTQAVAGAASILPSLDAWAYHEWQHLSQDAYNVIEQKIDDTTTVIFSKPKTNKLTTPPLTEGLSDTQLWLLQHNILAKPQVAPDTLVNGTKAVLATK